MSASRLTLLALFFACSEPSGTNIQAALPRAIDAALTPPVDPKPDATPPLDPQTFVDLTDLDPTILLDMRYASTNNFSKRAVYPKARCLLRAPVAQALLRVQQQLRTTGHQLWIWDCYRPFHVQEKFWELVPKPRFVAKPTRKDGKPWKGSKHNRGAAVDLSLADSHGAPLPMPTDHDDFSERAHRRATGIPPAAAANATILEKAMLREGFVGIDSEWWHYDFQSWEDYPLADEPL